MNAVKSENQFESATFNAKAKRIIADVETAAKTYQNLKDQLEKHSVTGEEQ